MKGSSSGGVSKPNLCKYVADKGGGAVTIVAGHTHELVSDLEKSRLREMGKSC